MHVILLLWIYRRFLINRCLSNSLSVPPVIRSFQPSWFSTRSCLHHDETYKISSASVAKIVPKSIKIVSTDVRNIKFSRGSSPEPPYERGNTPSRALPLAFGTRKTSLMFYGRTTFQKPTTALLPVLYLN